jgi:hypothetical protein
MHTLRTSVPPAACLWRGHPYRDKSFSSQSAHPQLVAETGPLNGFENRRVLAIIDVENLTISARKLGHELDYSAVARRLKSAARAVQLHAALSIERGDTTDIDHVRGSGFIVHTRFIERLRDGSKAANSDNVFAFQAGLLVSRASADAVILGSGDGQLVCDLAESIRALPAHRSVWTLSVPGATSFRLDCRRNPFIDGNVEIGTDVLLHRKPAGALIHGT